MGENKEEIRSAIIPEKQDKPGTKFGRWLKKTFGKKPETPLEQDAADITTASQKQREAVDREVQLPNKPYDLRAAIKHFESLKLDVKQKISDFFGGEWPNINKQDFVLFDKVYDFQDKCKLRKDAIAGPATREAMFGKGKPLFQADIAEKAAAEVDDFLPSDPADAQADAQPKGANISSDQKTQPKPQSNKEPLYDDKATDIAGQIQL